MAKLVNMWLTVNRQCNFRCKWCYAEGTDFKPEDDMSFETAKNLINLASDLGIRSVTFLGGEPTCWEHLFPAIQYAYEKKMKSLLVTNGYLLSKPDFLAKIKASNLTRITISLKASNEKQHKELTGTDTFLSVLEGIKESNNLEGKYAAVSYVLSEFTADSLIEVAKVLAACGTKSLSLDMCSVSFENGEAKKKYALHPNKYVKTIVDNIDEMCEIMDGRVSAPQKTMGCIWPEETLKRLVKERKINTRLCHMLGEYGVVFTNKAELIACNHLYNYPFGKYGIDFNDAESFLEFRNSEPITEFFKKIRTLPKTSCINCSQDTDCIGGCPFQWIIFDPAEIKNEYRNDQ